jgi:hypothetical protein
MKLDKVFICREAIRLLHNELINKGIEIKFSDEYSDIEGFGATIQLGNSLSLCLDDFSKIYLVPTIKRIGEKYTVDTVFLKDSTANSNNPFFCVCEFKGIVAQCFISEKHNQLELNFFRAVK